MKSRLIFINMCFVSVAMMGQNFNQPSMQQINQQMNQQMSQQSMMQQQMMLHQQMMMMLNSRNVSDESKLDHESNKKEKLESKITALEVELSAVNTNLVKTAPSDATNANTTKQKDQRKATKLIKKIEVIKNKVVVTSQKMEELKAKIEANQIKIEELKIKHEEEKRLKEEKRSKKKEEAQNNQ
jgi:uncharacterized protein involved in type VI secretion and phage assembly